MSRHYDYEDEEYPTDGTPVRSHTSQRRYQPQQARRTTEAYDEPITQRPVRRSRTTESHPPVRSSVPARATGQVRRQQPQQYVEPPVQRRVYQPPAQPRQQPQPEKIQPKVSRRQVLSDFLTTVGIGTGMMVVLNGIAFGPPRITQLSHQLEEGRFANTILSLVCGHYDSPAHPTQLQASLFEDGTIRFVEYPGGGLNKKAVVSYTQSIRSAYSGDLANVYLQIIPEQVDGKTYRIRLHMEIVEPFVSQPPITHDFYYKDSGKGYFTAVA